MPPLIRLLAPTLLALAVGACQAPALAPAAAPGGARLVLHLDAVGRRVQQVTPPTNAWRRADVDHVVVKLEKATNGNWNAVGQQTLLESELDSDIQFDGLEADTRYRAVIEAYAQPGADPRDRISAGGPASTIELAIGRDDAVRHERLVLTLRDREPLTADLLAGGELDETETPVDFETAVGVAADASGAIVVADAGSGMLQRVSPTGTLTPLADLNLQDPVATDAAFSEPAKLEATAAGVVVADRGLHRVYQVAWNGAVTLLAGTVQGDNDGDLITGALSEPSDVAVVGGDVYVADTGNHRIRRVSGGMMVTIAGDGTAGHLDGLGTAARLGYPQAIAAGPDNALYVADAQDLEVGPFAIRRVTPGGAVSTLMASGGTMTAGPQGAPAKIWQLPRVYDLAFDRAGGLLLATESGLFRCDRHGAVRPHGAYGLSDGTARDLAGLWALAPTPFGPLYAIDRSGAYPADALIQVK